MDIASDQIVGAEAAQPLSSDAHPDHAFAAWIIVGDQPPPDTFTGPMMSSVPAPYVLVEATLEELRVHALLGLRRSKATRSPRLGRDLVRELSVSDRRGECAGWLSLQRA